MSRSGARNRVAWSLDDQLSTNCPRRIQVTDKITLLAETAPRAVSAAVYWWVGCGSRHETPELHGATHLAEHMFFKGTSQHGPEEISSLFERFGGDVNAFTDRELTCFHAWVPAKKTGLALNLMSEMLFDSLFLKEDFEKERSVVVEELRGCEDSPEEAFLDGLMEVPWASRTSLGRRVGGFAKEVSRLKHAALVKHVESRFLEAPMAIGVVSPLEAEEVAELLRQALRRAEKLRFGKLAFRKPRRPAADKAVFTSRPRSRSALKSFDSDQVHVGILYPAPSVRHRDEPLVMALANLVGGGSSSALFRKLREDKGLTYSAYASYLSFTDTGLLTIAFSTSLKRWEEALRLSAEICRDMARGPKDSDFDFAQGQLQGSTLLGFESIHARAEMYGRQKLLLGRTYTLEESLREIADMTPAGLRRVARSLGATPCLYVLGPLTQRDLGKAWKAWEAGA